METEYRYPLGQHHEDSLRTATGLPLSELTLEAVVDGRLKSADLQISGETLRMQATVAERAGFTQFAENLRRGAELVGVSENDILRTYTALRPRRSTYAELMKLAEELERLSAARRMAAFIREAADAYRARGLTRPDE